MKIGFISSEYPPETYYGGIAAYTQNLARALVRRGHSVHVITTSPKRASTQLDDGVNVHRMKIGKGMIWWLPYRLMVLELVNRIGDFDLVEAPDFNAEGLGVTLFRKTLKMSSRFVTRLHTPSSILSDLYRNTGAERLSSIRWRLVYGAETVQVRRSDAIHSPTRIAAKIVADAMDLPLEKITVIPNGADIVALRKYLEIHHPDVPDDYILYFGRLEPRKGVHILAEALRTVFGEHPQICVVFAGRDTPFRGLSMKEWVVRVNKRNEKNLVFLGYVTEDCKKTLIRNSRFVVLPSLSEGFGYSCLEAMALGKAVIATAGTGFEEIVNKDSGFLVPAGDSLSLANQICYCIEQDLIRVERNATERSLDFDINRLIDDYIRFYKG